MSYRQILANLLTKSAAERMPPGWREPAEHMSISGKRSRTDPTRPAQYKQHEWMPYPLTKQQEVARRLSLTARNTGVLPAKDASSGRPAPWYAEGYPQHDVRRHALPIGHPRDPQD